MTERTGKLREAMERTERQRQQILAYLSKHEPATRDQIGAAVGLGGSKLGHRLKDMSADGLLAVVGRSVCAQWFIAGSAKHLASRDFRALSKREQDARRYRRRQAAAMARFEQPPKQVVVSVLKSGVTVPRNAVASVFDLGRLARAHVSETAHAAG